MDNFITCIDSDQDDLLRYVSIEPEFNLFIIGDIENFGVNNETVNIYVNVIDGVWDSLILRYLDNYIIYSHHEGYDALAVAEFLKDKEVNVISGKESILIPLAQYMPERPLRATYLSKLTELKPLDMAALDRDYCLRPLVPGDAGAVVELYCLVEEFADNYINRKEKATQDIAFNLEKGGIGYGIFSGEQILSVAATSAENSQSAMVIGVATHPEARKQGLASQVLTALCSASLSKGKAFLCLFYDNPEAGKIYQSLGFVEMGRYGMMKEKKPCQKL
jgi:hypothetical protein